MSTCFPVNSLENDSVDLLWYMQTFFVVAAGKAKVQIVGMAFPKPVSEKIIQQSFTHLKISSKYSQELGNNGPEH